MPGASERVGRVSPPRGRGSKHEDLGRGGTWDRIALVGYPGPGPGGQGPDFTSEKPAARCGFLPQEQLAYLIRLSRRPWPWDSSKAPGPAIRTTWGLRQMAETTNPQNQNSAATDASGGTDQGTG